MPRITAYIDDDGKQGVIYLPYKNKEGVRVIWYPNISNKEIEAIKLAKTEDVQKILSTILKSPLK